MSRIAYDPVKDRFAGIIRRSQPLRALFFRILDLFFLRGWYIRRILRRRGKKIDRRGPWNLLDAGSGFGQYDRYILRKFDNVNVTAVDVKDDYLSDARRYFSDDVSEGRISFMQADLLEFDQKELYHFVICVDVMEHIHNDLQAMKNLAGALRKGGWFLMHSPSTFSEEDAGEDDSFVDEHARVGYSKEDLRLRIESAGLTPVDISYTYGKKGHRAWQWIIKWPMLWMNRIGMWALPLMALWYIPVLPVALVLMWLDLYDEKEWGTGIYALARKEE